MSDLCFTPDGRQLLTVHPYNRVFLRSWDIQSGENEEYLIQTPDMTTKLAISPDGQLLAVGARAVSLFHRNPDPDAKPRWMDGWPQLKEKGLRCDWAPECLTFSTDGKVLASAIESGYGHFRMWIVESGNTVRNQIAKRMDFATRWMCFSPDGRWLVSNANSKLAFVWALGADNLDTPLIHRGLVYRTAFSPDCKMLATTASKRIFVWETETWELLADWQGSPKRMTALAWSPDGRRLFTGSEDRSVRVWDPSNGQELAEYAFDIGIPRVITFAPDGMTIAAGGGGCKIAIWDAE